MNPNQAVLSSTALTPDGTQVVQTYTLNLTQPQLTMQLAQAQNQLAALTKQTANVNALIANLQQQLALFTQSVIAAKV